MKRLSLLLTLLVVTCSGCMHGANSRGGLLGFGLLGNNNSYAGYSNGTQTAPPLAYQTPPQYGQPAMAATPQPAIAAQPMMAQQPIIVQQLPAQQVVQPANYYSNSNACAPVVCCPCN